MAYKRIFFARLRWPLIFILITFLFILYCTRGVSEQMEIEEKIVENDIIVTVNRTIKILFWIPFFGVKDYNFGLGNQPFIDHKCPVSNCYVTIDRDYVPIDKFDAILFHGGEYGRSIFRNFPKFRHPSQIYVYFSMEPPHKSPVNKNLNGIFNMTFTHRMDSDVVFPYFYFTDLSYNIIAPSLNPQWKTPDYSSIEKYKYIHKRKSKPAAWFVSDCKSKSNRESLVKELKKYIDVDVYGACGNLTCPRSNEMHCFNMLKNDYYFYLSFENSLCVDYVTEKVVNPYRYETIPVILGGYNISRFVPPDSYIDANKYSPQKLAELMKHLIENPREYAKYFWWKDHYNNSIEFDNTISPFCGLCKILNDPSWKPKSYNIYEWWVGTASNPVCKKPS